MQTSVAKLTSVIPLYLVAPILYLLVVLTAVVFPRWFTSRDPIATDLLNVNRPPSSQHWAGTDYLGRDVFTRIIYGARYSIGIGLAVVAISLIFGVLLGVLAGAAHSRIVDAVVMRAIDALSSFPSILLALVIVGLTGSGIPNLIAALGIGGIAGFARIVRAETKRVIISEYVEQSRTFGVNRVTTLIRHVIPNSLGVVPYMATIGVGGAIMGVSGLSFLGIGPQAPTPEWGSILSESRDYLNTAWWTGVIPGIVLVLTIISFTVIGRAWQSSFERRDV
ncbi:Glutathione porter, ABC transporter, permease yliD [Bifidobacterium psychraerophilum]|uniref:Glutathione porter, ABC transporter, permease yliD n=1 Tax=Bifidobacterium psychraerophilum TaxID=218140 RepID=A0A087CIX9_9BIFI|nr:Glutathione porter, ABC transporter, permease yliD [Bifidobacterium psychraerophilum]